MFGAIVVASAPDPGLVGLGMKFGLVSGQCVLNEDGSIKKAWNFAGDARTPEEFTADQHKMLRDHAARHPQGAVARELAEFAERSARARALRLALRSAPRRGSTPRLVPTRRAPRQARRVRRAASLVARSPDEPPTGGGGDAPRRYDQRRRGAP